MASALPLQTGEDRGEVTLVSFVAMANAVIASESTDPIVTAFARRATAIPPAGMPPPRARPVGAPARQSAISRITQNSLPNGSATTAHSSSGSPVGRAAVRPTVG